MLASLVKYDKQMLYDFSSTYSHLKKINGSSY